MGTSFSVTEADSNDSITLKLQSRQTLVTVLNWLQALGAIYLICQTVVLGYAIVTTPTGRAVPHAIWLIAPFVASLVVAHTTRFEVGLYLDTLTAGFRYTYVILPIVILTNGAAIGLFIWEFVQAVSDFYVSSYGYLIATIAVTGLFIVTEILLFFAVWVLHRDLEHAWYMGWKPRYSQYDPQYHPKEKMDDQEQLLPQPRQTSKLSSAPPAEDFDIELSGASVRSALRSTRVQKRKLLK
jgi:hypothetical protein